MNACEISMNERDLKIVYGMLNLVEKPRELALASVKYLYSDLTDIKKYYIRLGFHLEEFGRMCGYEDFGYLTLEEFCEVNLGLDKSAVSRCINVYREFNASSDRKYKNGVESHGCAMEISDDWKDYSYTQLCELLPLSPEQRKNVTPDMSIRQIREYKKILKGKPAPVASTQLKSENKFDYEKFKNMKGIVEQNYIKSRSRLGSRVVYIFDDRGRCILANFWCEILEDVRCSDNPLLVLRVCGSFEPAKKFADVDDKND